MASTGLRFWDYGNAFLLEVSRAFESGENQSAKNKDSLSKTKFKYPSYMQDVMGDIFSLGFGPFRWICTSGDHEDLKLTDLAAQQIFEETLKTDSNFSFFNSRFRVKCIHFCIKVPEKVRHQYEDNLNWIREANSYNLVVGSKARILYADQNGRVSISLAINKLVRDGKLNGPVVISRDHQ